jgi:ribosomal protein L11 methyltransferase
MSTVYSCISFSDLLPEVKDILIAQLSEAGYDGFEDNDNELKAFILADEYDENIVQEIASSHHLSFSKQDIAEQNWNQVWESNFEPVMVDDFVAIRADFHQPITGVEHEIVITPKMSFGTGHHATTYMMMQQMRCIDFKGRTVFDFGTGTGVLAILAEKLGAASITAIDNDDWSIDNAAENINKNNCSKIHLEKADKASWHTHFDIILANINKNVILDSLMVLSAQLEKGGLLLLSGLLVEDEQDILNAMQQYRTAYEGKMVRGNWICLRFSN